MLSLFRKIFFLRQAIINPTYFVKKIKFEINNLIAKKKYKKELFIEKQNYLYEQNNLNRNSAIKIFFDLSNKYEFLKSTSSSEHQILLSAISEKQNIKSILEIGTYDATNSFLISKLFPNSNIDTIDLPDDDEIFKNSYGRENIKKLNKLIDTRNNILKKNTSINFSQRNSVSLTAEKKKYDLIWIDGAHGYPVVTIDIINSLKLINSHGVILCDDVWIDKPLVQDEMYNSLASYETLQQLKTNNLINFSLFYKRLDMKNNSYKYKRKYIAFVKKNYE